MSSADNTLVVSSALSSSAPKTASSFKLADIFSDELLEFALSGAFALLMTAGMLRVLLDSAI
jgi:hypothetical protein